MSDSDPAGRLRLLTPDPPPAEHLNTAGKGNHPYHPSLRAVGSTLRPYGPEAGPGSLLYTSSPPFLLRRILATIAIRHSCVPALGGGQFMDIPPFASMMLPVIKLEACDARKTTASAISSGCPKRPRGTISPLYGWSTVIGVSMGPGAMPLT